MSATAQVALHKEKFGSQYKYNIRVRSLPVQRQETGNTEMF
jgi:hypothetical protein